MPQISITEKVHNTINGLNGSGKRILITGGPTCEDIDPVRFLTNRSTGRMGIALAEAAADSGCQPLLILGPTSIEVPENTACVKVRSAADMLEAVEAAFPWCEALVMSAAVADYTPVKQQENKIKKTEDGNLLLELKRTADILNTITSRQDRPGKLLAGFSLDTAMNIEEGRRKLVQKGLDLIAVNAVSAFGAAHSSVILLFRDGREIPINNCGKQQIAKSLLAELLQLA